MNCFLPLESFRIFTLFSVLYFMMIFLGLFIFFNPETGILTQWKLVFFFSSCFLIIHVLYFQKRFSWFIFFSIMHFFGFLVFYNEKYGLFPQLYLPIHLIKLLILASMQIVSKEFLVLFFLFVIFLFLFHGSLSGKHIF